MNGSFILICGSDSTGLKVIPATDGGENPAVGDIVDYLNFNKIDFTIPELNKAMANLGSSEIIIPLNNNSILPIRECMITELTDNNMTCIAKFMPPSDKGELMTENEILGDLKMRGVVCGIDHDAIKNYLANREYFRSFVIAKGVEPVQGQNASIEYMFNTDVKARPTLLDDGSVDFFNLNIINHCNEGDLLAKLHREVPGKYGYDITGQKIKPADIRRGKLKFGKNIRLSEDKTEIYSLCNGHVNLVDGRVFVSDLMEVENVDTATGNIEYEGNVQVNGNVNTNFTIKAKGNVEVRGIVEGATIIAGGNITIARGMNGMGKGVLRADGNVVAKFIENSTVEANGYVEASSIMHSQVMAGTEVHVGGKRGFISGGKVSATTLIDVKILGSDMGTETLVEIGVSPTVKKRYKDLNELINENTKVINRAIPIMEAARDKHEQGIELSEEQQQNIKGLAIITRSKLEEIRQFNKEITEIEGLLAEEKRACVSVRDTVYPGTKIIINDVSKIIKDSMKYCRFVKDRGDVRMIDMN